MKRKNSMAQHSKMLILFMLLFSLGNIFLSSPSNAEIKKDKDVTQVNFEGRLRFYLDLKTKRFLKKMALKEKLLLEMVEDVTSELKARGKPAC